MSANAIALITGDIDATRGAFDACLTDRSLSFDAESGFALQIISASDYLTKVALSNRQSVVNAVTNVAAIGISLNPAKKQAYLVPRKAGSGPVQVCLDISYMGLVELAISCGAIDLAQARIVRERDRFIDNGAGCRPTHEYSPFATDRGEVVGVYVAAKLPSGDWHLEMMTTDEINAIRDRSEAWKSLKAGKIKSCPWSTDWEEMAKKTVAKRGSKWWRGRGDTTRLDRAIHHLNTDGGEGLAELVPGVYAPRVSGFDPQAWIDKAKTATTEPGLVKIYGEAMTAAAAAQDKDGAAAFKAAAIAHRAKLRADNTVDA